jgi:hypothetical protein
VQNDLRELYNLATLVRPGTVGTFSQFRRNFLAGHDKRTPRNAPKLRSLLQTVMIRARRADTDIVFAPRRVETLWVAQSRAERKLYKDVSDFVCEGVRAGPEEGPGRQHYFTLVVLQKEMGSSWAAARGTIEKLARKPDGLDAKRLRHLAAEAEKVGQSQSKLRSLLKRIEALKGQKAIVLPVPGDRGSIVQALRGRHRAAIFTASWAGVKEEALDPSAPRCGAGEHRSGWRRSGISVHG